VEKVAIESTLRRRWRSALPSSLAFLEGALARLTLVCLGLFGGLYEPLDCSAGTPRFANFSDAWSPPRPRGFRTLDRDFKFSFWDVGDADSLHTLGNQQTHPPRELALGAHPDPPIKQRNEQIGAADAAFRSLGDPLFDTTSSQGRLLLAVLAAIASFEGAKSYAVDIGHGSGPPYSARREILVQRLQSERSPLCLEAAREITRTAAMLREAKAEIIRPRDAKRHVMQIADERAKEVVDLRMRLAKSYAVDVSMISRLSRKSTDR
jgi:hypothetical protein